MSTKKVEAAIAEIAERHGGRLTPAMVVAEAASERSPLHSHFEWDDERAAVAHRLDQARALIRSIQIKVVVSETVLRAPRFVRDPAADREQGYVALMELRSDEDRAREVLVAEFTRAAAVLARARSIATFLDLDSEIEDLRSQVLELGRKVEGGTITPTAGPAQ